MPTATQTASQSRNLAQSTARVRMIFWGTTSASLTVTISKNGGAFAALGGTVAEVANGWYAISLNTTDTNTVGDLAYHVTDGTNVLDFADEVTHREEER